MDSRQLAYTIRKKALDMVNHSHASHIGGVFSSADIVAVLYSDILNILPADPNNPNRDRFILSKGHCGITVYVALAKLGFFDEAILDTYGDNESPLSCHISSKFVPGVELATGSLGHGCCVACGMALNGKLRKRIYRVYTLIGDGECNEGTVWEMAAFASHNKLDNFTVIIDRNGMQAMGFTKDVLDMEPLAEKWNAFGWDVVCVSDGNDHNQLKSAFQRPVIAGKPRVIIASTVKGKGVSFMENELLWHYRDPQGELYEKAKIELENMII